jgi:hypothetical protein
MEFAKLLVQLAGIIIGWVVVHHLSAARDIDKARREMVGKAADGLVDDVTKLFSIAKEYHIKERSLELEDTIKISLQDISSRTALLHVAVVDAADLTMCTRAITELRKAITGEHFEDEHDGPKKTTDDQIKLLADGVLRAKRLLLGLKLKQFPAAGPKR